MLIYIDPIYTEEWNNAIQSVAENEPGQESLTEGKDPYSWPPCPNEFISVAFLLPTLIFYKTNHFNE